MATMICAAALTAEWKYFLIEFCWFVLCTMLMKFMLMVALKSYATGLDGSEWRTWKCC